MKENPTIYNDDDQFDKLKFWNNKPKQPGGQMTKFSCQEEFCIRNALPFFAQRIKCENCDEIFWDFITIDFCSETHMTGCPLCGQTWCD